MQQARWSMRSGLGRWLGGSGRPRILAAVVVAAVAGLVVSGGAVARYPGKNGILTWDSGRPRRG